MTKAIIIGDTHITVKNIIEVDKFIDKIVKLIDEKKPDFVVLLGDTLDSNERIHTTPLNRAYNLIRRIRNITKLYVLVGNHDLYNNIQYLTDNHWLNALKEWNNVTIVDTVISENINGKNFIFSPYVPNGRFIEALNTLDVDWKNADCIFAHQEFKNCKMESIESINGDRWSVDYPNVISGHIHLNQKPQNNIYYPGSSMPVAFEEYDKYIIAYVIFNDEKFYDLEEIDLHLNKKEIIYVDIENIDEVVIHTTDNKIKLYVSGSYEKFKTFKETKKCIDLVKSGIIIDYKRKKVEIKKHIEDLKDTLNNNPNDFKIILKDIVYQQKNSYLIEAWEEIVNNRIINPDDILIM